jgi:hypothetical protein
MIFVFMTFSRIFLTDKILNSTIVCLNIAGSPFKALTGITKRSVSLCLQIKWLNAQVYHSFSSQNGSKVKPIKLSQNVFYIIQRRTVTGKWWNQIFLMSLVTVKKCE